MLTIDHAEAQRLRDHAYNKVKCPTCGSPDRGTDQLPCPYCHPSKVKAGKVLKGVARVPRKDTKVGAVYKSRSQPGVRHEVRVDKASGKFVSCSCPSFFHRGVCRHRTRWLELLTKKGRK